MSRPSTSRLEGKSELKERKKSTAGAGGVHLCLRAGCLVHRCLACGACGRTGEGSCVQADRGLRKSSVLRLVFLAVFQRARRRTCGWRRRTCGASRATLRRCARPWRRRCRCRAWRPRPCWWRRTSRVRRPRAPRGACRLPGAAGRGCAWKQGQRGQRARICIAQLALVGSDWCRRPAPLAHACARGNLLLACDIEYDPRALLCPLVL